MRFKVTAKPLKKLRATAFFRNLHRIVNAHQARTAIHLLLEPIEMIQRRVPASSVGIDDDRVGGIEGVGGVVYVKEETQPCGQRISQILKRAPGVSGVFGGAGGRYIIDELTRGAVGTMPACELAETHVALMAAHRAGDDALARTLYERMLPILMMQAVFRWRLTKAVLVERGWIDNALTRSPGVDLDDHDHAEMRRWLDRVSDLLEPLRVAAA